MVRILYLSASLRLNGYQALRGREFARLLAQEEDLLLRHCWSDDRLSAIAANPDLEGDLTDGDELSRFDPQVVFAEDGIEMSPGTWRLPTEYLDPFLRNGGILIIEGASRSYLQLLPPAERQRLYEFVGASPELGPDSTDPGKIWNPTNPAELRCFAGDIVTSDWLRPTFEGIDSLLIGDAVPLASMQSLLASSGSETAVLQRDTFVSSRGQYVWATVRPAGRGFVVFLAADVSHDYFVNLCPDNARWLQGLMAFLVDEVDRNRLLDGHAEPSRAAIDVAALIAAGESHTVEFKECAWAEPVMRGEFAVTLAAFANADGGHLVIGVRDDGEVIGIDADLRQTKSKDRFQLQLGNVMRSHLEPAPPAGFDVRFEFVAVKGREVLVVAVQGASAPIWCRETKGGAQQLYVRSNATSQKLEGKDLAAFIRRRGSGT